jgi:chemotaxis signal transduction protein
MVHIADPRVRWSVAAARVVRIVPASEWRGPLVDVLVGLGELPASTSSRRVVVVRGADDRDIAVLAAGAIDIAEVDPSDVLELPDTFAAIAPQIYGIVVASNRSLSLLLQTSAVLPPDDRVLDEELCPSRS